MIAKPSTQHRYKTDMTLFPSYIFLEEGVVQSEPAFLMPLKSNVCLSRCSLSVGRQEFVWFLGLVLVFFLLSREKS